MSIGSKISCTINESVNIGYLFGGLNFIVNDSLTSILDIHWNLNNQL